MEQVMEKVKKTRVLGLIGIIGLILGTILPYIKVSLFGYSQTLSLWKYWEGKVIILLAVLNTMFIFKDYIKQYVPQLFNSPFGKWIENANDKMSLIPTVLSAVFAIYLYSELSGEMGSYLKYSVGFYVLWASIACLVAFSFLYKGNGEATVQAGTTPTQPMQPPAATPVAPQPVQTAPVQQPTAMPATKFCPNCGNKVDANINQCPTCGSQI